MTNLFILGAGFSKPAGLPLGDELFSLIKDKFIANRGYSTLEESMNLYLDYYNNTHKKNISEDKINFEDFLSYLDIEYYLGLPKDSSFREGNRIQLLIKCYIAEILKEKIFQMQPEDYELYESFVKKLDPSDIIITFNYDTILENSFDRLKKPYRFFYSGNKGVTILKMHGSIDWFDKNPYNMSCKNLEPEGFKPTHYIFNNPKIYEPEEIFEHAYEDYMKNIYRMSLDKIDKFDMLFPPLIISPSYSKIIYVGYLNELWRGLSELGYDITNLGIIGFSLSEHDNYIKQPLYGLIKGFQESDVTSFDYKKMPMKIIDYSKNCLETNKFKKRYSFVDWNKTILNTKGFAKKSLNQLF